MKATVDFLLVEDDEVDVETVQYAWEEIGFPGPLDVAENGLEALEYLREKTKNNIDFHPIILLDLNMPKMNGLEFLAEIRKDPALRSSNVFVLTTSDDERDKRAAFEYNVSGYFVKPLHFEHFVDIMKTLEAYWKICEFPNGH